MQGIYKIVNKVNGKLYIGSSKNIYKRKGQHYSELRGNYHENIFLQRAWNKYGEHNFEFLIVEEVKEHDALKYKEQYYIDLYFDEGTNCYNLNKSASIPPRKCNPCLVYTKEGKFIKEFESQRECSYYLGVDETSVRGAMNRENSLCSNHIVKLKQGCIEESIEPYKERNINIVYILDEENNILKIFNNIPELSIYIKGERNKIEETKISCCLHLIHKYKKIKIIYKSDYDDFKGYIDEKLKTYKYILKYDYYGNLLESVDNKYGLKFIGAKADNCKINTRLILLGRGDSLRVLDNKYIYIRSNEIIENIQTNITEYSYYDLKLKYMKNYLKKKDLLSDLNISKGTFDYYLNNKQEYNERYLFKKEIY